MCIPHICKPADKQVQAERSVQFQRRPVEASACNRCSDRKSVDRSDKRQQTTGTVSDDVIGVRVELVDASGERKSGDPVSLTVDPRWRMAKGQEVQEMLLGKCSWRRSVQSEENG